MKKLHNQEKIQRKFNRAVELHTKAVIHLLNINSHDTGLIMLCGSGYESNNLQAVKTWISQALCCPSCTKTFSSFDLAEALYKHLERQQQEFKH